MARAIIQRRVARRVERRAQMARAWAVTIAMVEQGMPDMGGREVQPATAVRAVPNMEEMCNRA